MNWDTIILAAVTGLPATIVAAAAFVQAWKTHKAVNSRMTELLEITRQSAGDAATLREKSAQKSREGDRAVDAAKPQAKK